MTSIALSSPSLSHSSAHSAPAAIAAAGHRRIDTGASDSDSAHTVTTSATTTSTAVENGAASRTSVSVTSKPQEQHQHINDESVIPLPAAPDSLPLPLRNTSTASTPASGNGVDSKTATGGGRAPPFLVQLSAFPLNNPTSLYSPKNPLLPTSSLPNRVHKPSHMAAAAAESTAVFSVPSPAIHQHQHPDPTLDDNDVDSASTPTQPPNFVRVSRFVELFDLVDVSPRARVVFVPHPAGKYTTPVPAYRPAPTVVKKRRKDAVPFPPSTSAVLEAETSRAPPVDDAVNNEQISGNNSAPIATTEPTLIPLPPSRSASPHPVAAQPPIPLSSSSSSEAPYDNNTSSSSIPPPPPRSSLRPAPSRLNSAASSTHSIKRQHSNSFAALSSNPPEDPTPEEPEPQANLLDEQHAASTSDDATPIASSSQTPQPTLPPSISLFALARPRPQGSSPALFQRPPTVALDVSAALASTYLEQNPTPTNSVRVPPSGSTELSHIQGLDDSTDADATVRAHFAQPNQPGTATATQPRRKKRFSLGLGRGPRQASAAAAAETSAAPTQGNPQSFEVESRPQPRPQSPTGSIVGSSVFGRARERSGTVSPIPGSGGQGALPTGGVIPVAATAAAGVLEAARAVAGTAPSIHSAVVSDTEEEYNNNTPSTSLSGHANGKGAKDSDKTIKAQKHARRRSLGGRFTASIQQLFGPSSSSSSSRVQVAEPETMTDDVAGSSVSPSPAGSSSRASSAHSHSRTPLPPSGVPAPIPARSQARSQHPARAPLPTIPSYSHTSPSGTSAGPSTVAEPLLDQPIPRPHKKSTATGSRSSTASSDSIIPPHWSTLMQVRLEAKAGGAADGETVSLASLSSDTRRPRPRRGSGSAAGSVRTMEARRSLDVSIASGRGRGGASGGGEGWFARFGKGRGTAAAALERDVGYYSDGERPQTTRSHSSPEALPAPGSNHPGEGSGSTEDGPSTTTTLSSSTHGHAHRPLQPSLLNESLRAASIAAPRSTDPTLRARSHTMAAGTFDSPSAASLVSSTATSRPTMGRRKLSKPSDAQVWSEMERRKREREALRASGVVIERSLVSRLFAHAE